MCGAVPRHQLAVQELPDRLKRAAHQDYRERDREVQE